jgi:hypothetical protein
MFLVEEIRLPVGVDEARGRLQEYLQAGGLQGDSDRAFSEGRNMLIRAGVLGVSKEVQVQVLPPYLYGATMLVPLRWVATGPSGAMFPQLDANLELMPDGAHGSILRVSGSYRPPLGAVGATLDRVVLHRVAEATSRTLLQKLARALTGDSSANRGARVDADSRQNPQ